jgi:hypothetical protein
VALSKSLLSEVVSGRLNTATFANIDSALIGKRMYGPKPGIATLFNITFLANGKAEYAAFDPEAGAMVPVPNVTWSVSTVAGKKKISIKNANVTTVYSPTVNGLHIELRPAAANAAV